MNNRMKQLFSVPVGVAIWWIGLMIIILAFGTYVGITRKDNVSFGDVALYEKYASKVKETYEQMGKCKEDPDKINNSNIQCLILIDKNINSLKYENQIGEKVIRLIEKNKAWKDISPSTVRAMQEEINQLISKMVKGQKVEI